MAEQQGLRRARQVLPWLAAGVLAAAAAGLGIEAAWGEGGEPTTEVSVGQSGQIIAVAGKITPETHGLYLIDLKNGTISVYQYFSGSQKHGLRLMASRNYTFDVQLDEYNTEPPVKDIRKLVQEHKRVANEK